MSKSILVIDTPDSCCECPLQYKAELISLGNFTYKQHYGCRCIPENIEDYCIPDVFSKPDWCPLSTLPSYRPINEDIKRGDTKSMTHLITSIHDIGYNECLDDILKGKGK